MRRDEGTGARGDERGQSLGCGEGERGYKGHGGQGR